MNRFPQDWKRTMVAAILMAFLVPTDVMLERVERFSSDVIALLV